ncbi:MAG: DUF1549 domain-containing protein [Planctomycetaceae bacterium]
MRASVSLSLLGVLLSTSLAPAQDEPLHTLIDGHLLSTTGVTASLCNDAEFLRRVSLDLTGMPPTAEDVREFLADTAADKRVRSIDRLLDSPHFARHLTTTLDVMLMERRGNTHVPQDDWYAWLYSSVRENKPWNVLVRAILSADGDGPESRPQARFFLDRESEPNLLTRDVGRIFFGRDLQCAQCHDHPLIDDYLQADYHGLLAFLAPGYAVIRKETVKDGDKETTKEVTLLAEKAGNDLTFESVFIQGTPHRTGPRLFDDVAIDEPFWYPGEEYEIAPADGVKSVPKFSRRARLAERATDGSNRMFNENIANRMWAHMLGRGLVHPVDLHQYDNPPTDPALLKLLGERLAAMNFDLRGFLREVALSQVYQRSFDGPDEQPAIAGDAAAKMTELELQHAQLADSAAASAAVFETARKAWGEAEAAILPAAGELDKARTAYAEARKKLDDAQQELAKVQQELDQKQSALASVQLAATAAQQAVQALQDDQELAAAAQKFAERAQQLTDAVAALTKSVEEKTAAATAPAEALAGAKPPVDAALATLAPLEEALRLAEQAMLTARRQMRTDAVALSALDRRLETVQKIAALPARQQSIETNREAVAARQRERDAAQTALTEYASVLSGRKAAVTSADAALASAIAALAETQSIYNKRLEIAQAVQTASDAARAASDKLPDDSVLADAAQTLKDRAGALNAQMGESRAAVDKATAAVDSARQSRDADRQTLEESQAEQSRRAQSLAGAETSVAAAQTQLAASEAEYVAAESELTGRWSADFTLASLKPLTPEQLCWSIFQVTGVYDRYWQTEAAELEKSSPLTDEQKQNPSQMAAREVELEQRTFDKLKSNVGTFVQFYAAAAGQPQGDFFATADQALFTANGGSINSWVAPSGGNVTERVIHAAEPATAAEELYLAVLNRFPAAEETAEVAAYLANRQADRAAAAQELVWGLLNSIEFRFNH